MAKPDRLYQDLLREMRRQVAESFAPGEPLPTQRALAAMHGVSQGTVFKAMAALAKEGTIASQGKRGWTRAPGPGRPSATRRSRGVRLERIGFITRHARRGLETLFIPVHAALKREAERRGIEVVWALNPYDHHPTPSRNRINFTRVPWNEFQIGLLLEVEQGENLSDPILKSRKVLSVDFDATGYGLHSVTFDDRMAGALAARHLLELGHRRLAVPVEVNPPIWPAESTWMDRKHGFEAEAGRLGGYIHPAACLAISRFGNWTKERQAIRDWADAMGHLPGLQRPTALFIPGLPQPGEVLAALRQAGLKVPGDCSLLHVDFERRVENGLALTCVRLDLPALARRVFDLAEDLCHNEPASPVRLMVPVLLAPGQSSAPPPSP